MKRLLLAIVAILTMSTTQAQTAQQVLDKCAALVSTPDGATANFTMTSAQYGNASGTISIKGQKFYMHSNATTMWFDGATLWTYVAQNEEVNISTPTAQQLQSLNPYHFINLYKQGYDITMNKNDKSYTVHLTAQKAGMIPELFITIDKESYHPTQVKMLQGKKWTTFNISNLKAMSINDATFQFDAKDFPSAEIIDLR